MECMPRKVYRCGYEDNLIEIFLKPPKDNYKRRKQVHFNEKYNRACNNGENNNDQNIYIDGTYVW